MSEYKTILVHLANDNSHMERFAYALSLARTFESHLIALYNPQPVSMPVAGRGASLGFLAESLEISREKGKRVQVEVERACETTKMNIEWRWDEGDQTKTLATHAVTADLAIVSHAKAEEAEDRVVFHAPENLVLRTGCPLIVLSHPLKQNDSPKTVAVAWNGSKYSQRAIRDSMPFLKRAERVVAISNLIQDDNPEAMLQAFLNRHGVKAEVIGDPALDHYAGKAIVQQAKALKADLLVMGAYGHSRLHDVILGSTTKTVAASIGIPALLSH